jgi:hypothetical protein
MAPSLGSSCTRLLLIVALPGCVADPTSLGDPPATETSADPGTTHGDDDPGATGQVVTEGDGNTSTASGDEPGTTTTDGSTSTEGGNTTGDPLDAAMVIFVNFDGAVLTLAEVDDATLDQSVLDVGMPLAPYGVGPKRDEVMAFMAEYWAPFDVGVTSTRPATGDYTMIVVTPTNPFPSAGGIAPLDCDNANLRTVGLVFGSIDDAMGAVDVAAIITHVVADGMGLEHTEGGGFTHPFSFEDYNFVDACVPIFGEPFCVAQHAPFCPPGQQNAFAELSAWFPL